ncbi:CorA family divalent cation transporter [Paenibacillus xylaniclasticus]|uniref:CorA family divalent cation transporter n=1 Tax=Paenibacillus xylaniclasticus TaxID=588083 RepID=UPI000FD8A4B0|nr:MULTISPECIES: CorA family divalent cation transporter [Paenibacillus]GFN33081.1 hypothetical protein PCURB6_33410 [Paenibacillus curdlanolyticus]
MNERTFRFPSGWEWVQLRQPFAQELHAMMPRDERSGIQAELSASSLIPPRSSRTVVPAKHAAASRILIESRRKKLEYNQAHSRLHSLKQRLPECSAWLDGCFDRSVNHIVVHRLQNGEPVLYGTLLIQQSSDQADIQPFRFWVTSAKLITIHEDWRLSIRLQQPPWDVQLQQCSSGQEAFVTILTELLEPIHYGLDDFEQSLGKLEHAIRRPRRRSRMNLMTTILERRYDLLHWHRMFMSIKELNGAVKEAFVSLPLFEREPFQRLQHKLERIEALLKTYTAEIDTLISMDDAISSFRGNDIMKTLTMITVLFAPAMVVGTLWGMNFVDLPWTAKPWGFVSMCAIVIAATALIFLWIWRKDWTGNVLNTQNIPPPQNKDLESAASHELRRSRKGTISVKPNDTDHADSQHKKVSAFSDTSFTEGKSRRRS